MLNECSPQPLPPIIIINIILEMDFSSPKLACFFEEDCISIKDMVNFSSDIEARYLDLQNQSSVIYC